MNQTFLNIWTCSFICFSSFMLSSACFFADTSFIPFCRSDIRRSCPTVFKRGSLRSTRKGLSCACKKCSTGGFITMNRPGLTNYCVRFPDRLVKRCSPTDEVIVLWIFRMLEASKNLGRSSVSYLLLEFSLFILTTRGDKEGLCDRLPLT